MTLEEGAKTKTIVFFTFGSIGHVNPILSVVKELTRRGHRAIVLTLTELTLEADFIEQGYDFRHCLDLQPEQKSNNRQDDEKMLQMKQPLLNIFRAGLPKVFEDLNSAEGGLGNLAASMLENQSIYEEKLKSLNPDLIVTDLLIGAPCALTVAPKWVRVHSSSTMDAFSELNDNCVCGLGLKICEMSREKKLYEIETKRKLRAKVAELWKSFGLDDWPCQTTYQPESPYLNVCFGPDELALEKFFGPMPNNWLRLEHAIGANDSVAEREFKLPVELEKLPGKLIYFSLGTVFSNDVEVINQLLETLSKSQNKFIVSMGPFKRLIKLHPNMWGDTFVDQKAILPKVDLFITHAGNNSLIEAFYYGVPGMIALPGFGDQFDNAQMIEDGGFGVRLDPYKCSEEELLGAIDSILSNVDMRQRMESISKRMKSFKSQELFADKLLELIS